MSSGSDTLDETIEATRGENSAPRDREPTHDPHLVQGEFVGRYVVLTRLGAGAMGVVYAAYDPELDRKVAVKLLRTGRTTDHRRLLREAQALARLGHPNVVTVHDVGEHDGRVFVAMEFVDGRTARQWVADTQPAWPEVLDVFVQAGRGLQAAHDKGLVHRDFKPDNVMVGERVRVMDFGLARAGAPSTDSADPDASGSSRAKLYLQLTQDGTILGTPAYMAPEQLANKDSGPLSDQFSFCVSVWESLFRQRPFAGTTVPELAAHVLKGTIAEPPSSARVPRWLRRALVRGLAVDPDARWPSVQALLHELSRGRARARWQFAAVGVVVTALVAIAVLVSKQLDWQQRVAACTDAGATIHEAWNDDARAALRSALLATGARHAELTADKVAPWLDAQAEAWQRTRTEVCMNATVDMRIGWTADVDERAQWCLEERRLELQALVTELTHGEARAPTSAVLAATDLRRVEPCSDANLLLRLPAPPADRRDAVLPVLVELARASALDATGDYRPGLDIAIAAREHAEVVDWPPLVAAAHSAVGRQLQQLGRYRDAEAELERAYFAAAQAGASELAAQTADDLAHMLGSFAGRPADAMRWSEHAEVHHAAIPDPTGLREARHLAARGSVLWSDGRYAEALPLYERALELREAELGPTHPEVAKSLSRIAIVLRALGRVDEARSLLERAVAILEEALGPDHPEVAQLLINLGNVEQTAGNAAASRDLFERALAIEDVAAGRDHHLWARAVMSLATSYQKLGQNDRAIPLYERGLKVLESALGPEHPEVAAGLINLGNSHLQLGATEQAGALFRRALEIEERAFGPDHPDVAIALHNVGAVEFQLKHFAEARRLLERANEINERRVGPDHPELARTWMVIAMAWHDEDKPEQAIAPAERAVALLERNEIDDTRLAGARFVLAGALWDAGREHTRALELAEQALVGYRDAGELHATQTASVEGWLEERRAIDIEH